MDYATVLNAIQEWSIDEQRRLINDVCDGLEPERPPAMSEAKMREIDRRLAEHEANPDDVVPWEEVEAAARARVSK